MLTVYGVYRSRATRIYWLAGELGLSFRQVPVIQAYRLADHKAADAPLNTQSAQFLAINPAGQIPVIDDDGLILKESLAITLYLAKKHGGELAPKDLAEDALMTSWSLFGATEIEPNALTIMLTSAKPQTGETQATIDAAACALMRPFAALEEHFAHNDYAVANRFTVGDINLAETVRYAQGNESLFAEFAHVKTWLERCQSRPAFKAMWDRRATEPA